MSLEDKLYPLLPLYQRMPQALKAGLGTAYRALPEQLRLGDRYRTFRSLAEDCEAWDESRAADYQLEQLRAVLVHAQRWSPYYASSFAEAGFRPGRLSSPGDLAACPMLTKADLARRLGEVVAARPGPARRLYMTTGGSTGTPVGFYLHKGVSRPKEQAFLEAQWRRAGYFDGARLAVLRSQAPSRRADGPVATYDATRDWLVLSPYQLTEERFGEYLSAVARFRPDILHAYPSAALQVVSLLERTGRRWPVPLRCVLAASERLSTAQKRDLEATFQCRVFTWYGHSERAVLAAEGRRSQLQYFWPAYGYVEFGEPDEEGLREVIATSFHNYAMPLVRYRTGDYVRVSPADSSHEYPWPAVEAVEGRAQEVIVTGSGRRVPLTALNMHDATFEGAHALQFVQKVPGVVGLHYVAGHELGEERLGAIAGVLRHRLGEDCTLSITRVDAVEKTSRGKGKWLVTDLS
jgi:phenylacetate-CoA ligase